MTDSILACDTAGAHVTAIGDVLYTSPETRRMPEAPIRGGIPLIGPQFGTRMAAAFPTLPSHGVLRREEWTIVDATETHLEATLTFDGVEYRYTVDVQLADADAAAAAVSGFVCRLEARNTGVEDMALQLGFHPYFALGDVRQATVKGVGAAVIADFRGPGTFQAPMKDTITFTEAGYDRGVRGARTLSIVDPVAGRTITVSSDAADTFVVWNPGVEQARGFADMPDEGWLDFVCVEPMIHGAAGDGEPLPAGQTLRLDMTVRVEQGVPRV
ncbi:hypothetical protein C1Y63_07470 [Corynebacterium sp. 13CS0277]|uniref:aldose epimerase family protein n=1 Tax=Corynebacterium sp. 13CS0277 TaxID=2071994 RepID=UPI000D045A6B|nr:hypothetical protein [Corynebacterium sp. 13CS0277]PRQ11216.1 hypothetical protein C1Y63_07470 [Corynebacterium sp. 13CS0277]